MEKKSYKSPEIETLALQQEGILCASDELRSVTGASWGTEDGSGVEFIL